jgi:hypothetical protein
MSVMNMENPKASLATQSGMVSITVTVVFIMVISLIVLGFSQVSRRNSREALDRQLSSQAFYAAEAGINDAQREIIKQINNGENVKRQDTCNGAPYAKDNGKVGDFSYTCLTVNPEPRELQYGPTSDASLAIPLNAVDKDGNPTVISAITVSWKRTAGKDNINKPATCPKPTVNGAGQLVTNFPTASNWAGRCPFGVLRVDIVPTTSENLADPIAAARNTMTAFVYPKAGGGGDTLTYGNGSQNGYTPNAGAPQGLVQSGGCDDEICKFVINGLNFPNAYMRVRTVYLDAQKVSVRVGDSTVEEDGSFTPTRLKGAQALVDSTGKSQDVLRRLQVRIPLVGKEPSDPAARSYSDYALQTTDSICKRYVVSSNYGSDPGCSTSD